MSMPTQSFSQKFGGVVEAILRSLRASILFLKQIELNTTQTPQATDSSLYYKNNYSTRVLNDYLLTIYEPNTSPSIPRHHSPSFNRSV